MDDIRHGRVTEYKSADDMFEKLGIQEGNFDCLKKQANYLLNI